MTTTVHVAQPAPTRGSASTRAKSEFGPLRDRIVADGLLERRIDHYLWRGTLILLGLAAVAAGIVLLSGSWWVLLLAPVAAIVSAQVSFLGHDAGHQQISESRKTNRVIGVIAANVLAGISYGWWQDKHLRHHANPNQEGLDPDVGESIIAWSEEQAAKKTGFARWFARHQAAFFFPLLTFEGWNLSVAGFRALKARPAKARTLEVGLLVLHFAVYFGFLFILLPPPVAILFILIHRGLYGLNLGSAFAPNHKGMPMPPAGSRLDHLHKQVLTSRDVLGGPVVDFMLGGLNYQIEHHLFPSMPRPHLKLAQPIIRDYCATIDLPYRACGVIESYGECLRHLHKAGH
ncbi:acyl-CoA desaturase [Microlunatus panaciterrae]|uniref:Fatty acid desaturase n=1 Tax=Microlunatus panaciterrae TaxID=400768 RepID=A0ABS2RHV8_9ACTN|nr:fatty acid desaturase [Microlunatus panaciterrae]MBM7798579.1 fatty acid desaturase [Microlunatus panaciterrae]